MTHIIDLAQFKFDRPLLLKIARFFSDQEGTCLLYSGSPEADSKSFLCLFPYDCIEIHDQKRWRSSPIGENRLSLSHDNPWDALQVFLSRFEKGHSYPEYVGFIGYEMGVFSDPEKKISYTPAPTPDAYFQRCAVILAVDHRTGHGQLILADQGEYLIDEGQRKWVESLRNIEFWPEFIERLSDAGERTISSENSLEFKANETLESYTSKIFQAKELIKSGDIYQVNLSQQFSFHPAKDPFDIFHSLVVLNPAPYSVFLKLKNMAIVSSSPERFLRKNNGVLETRPIKGTAPRGKTPEEDISNREALLASTKERAELLMITDLMRNDLGRISQPGSVEAVSLWDCEAYANVYHMVSTIRSKVNNDIHPVQLLRTCFPGGSITGCPKLSAMETIVHLEKRPRGVYTGSIGYFAGNGDFDFNIAIRTLVVHNDHIDLQLGGAIVADSDPEKEYQETLHKGASIFQVLGHKFI